jgi:hypothetical protein
MKNIRKFTNPDLIHGGDMIKIPNKKVVTLFVNALTLPLEKNASAEKKQFVKAIIDLNHLPPMSKKAIVKDQVQTLKQIETFTQNQLAS